MTQKPTRTSYWNTRRKARGVSMLFLLITIPVLFAFAALAVDVGRLLEAHRSLQQAVDESAQSGATAYALGSDAPRLDPPAARAYAVNNWNQELDLGAITARDATLETVTATATSVTVEARATVDQLLFLRYFRIIGGDGTWPVHAVGEATVCLAGYDGERACTRPDA